MKTKFNPENKETISYGEALDPAMGITEQEDANQYLREYIAYTQKWLDKEPRGDDVTAEQIVKVNLGYYAGYYNHETRIRVERLFKCNHPIFGSAKTFEPTPEEAFNKGLTMGK